MNYIDVCTGISSPTVAWSPLGWKALAYSEIEKAPSAVLAHHYPNTPNLGDMTKFEEWPDYADVDVLVGGTPCQSYSIAGKRKGLADPRGQLMLSYLGIADRYRPRWVVWENVPGVLSSNGGRDFGTFLGALAKLGYGFAYRVLDAQYFGLAQRRERVFVVGHLGDWRRAAEVLLERESLCGYPAPRREPREDIAHDLAPSLTASGRGVERAGDSRGQDPVVAVMGGQIANCLTTHAVKGGDPTTDNYVVTGGFFDEPAHTLRNAGLLNPILHGLRVRRITPREAERLQGMPDDYTLVPYRGRMMADGPRYKMLGNSMASHVVRWIGRRIDLVDSMTAGDDWPGKGE